MKRDLALEKINQALEGKYIKCLGWDSYGRYAKIDQELQFRVKRIEYFSTDDENMEDEYGNIDIYLGGYEASEIGMLYSDEKTIRSLNRLLRDEGIEVMWSEQGKQGGHFINVDFETRGFRKLVIALLFNAESFEFVHRFRNKINWEEVEEDVRDFIAYRGYKNVVSLFHREAEHGMVVVVIDENGTVWGNGVVE